MSKSENPETQIFVLNPELVFGFSPNFIDTGKIIGEFKQDGVRYNLILAKNINPQYSKNGFIREQEKELALETFAILYKQRMVTLQAVLDLEHKKLLEVVRLLTGLDEEKFMEYIESRHDETNPTL